MAEHMDQIHHGIKTDFSGNGTSAVAYSDTETYCAYCERWIKTPGVTGWLRFMGKHRDGDCSPQKKAEETGGAAVEEKKRDRTR